MKLVLAMICFLGNQTVAASSLANLITNKKTWTKVDWNEFHNSEVFKDSTWNIFDGNEVRIKVVNDSIGKIPLEFVITKRDSVYSLFISERVTLSQCSKLLSFVKDSFGSTSKFLDLSSEVPLVPKEKVIMKFTDLAYQWDIGKTRVTYKCNGFGTKNEKDEESRNNVSLQFTQRDDSPDLKPLITLQCTQTIKSHSNNRTEKSPDYYFVVDEFNSKLRNRDYTALHGVHELTEDFIHVRIVPSPEDKVKFNDSRDTVITDYKIDRTTGDYIVKVNNLEDKTPILTITGKCKKSKLPKKLF